VLLFATPLLLCASACSRDLRDVRTTDRKVLLLGVDGLDLKALEPMLLQGHLPRFAELRRHAIELPLFGERITVDGTSTGIDPARCWTTVATGAPAARVEGQKGKSHGIVSLTRACGAATTSSRSRASTASCPRCGTCSARSASSARS